MYICARCLLTNRIVRFNSTTLCIIQLRSVENRVIFCPPLQKELYVDRIRQIIQYISRLSQGIYYNTQCLVFRFRDTSIWPHFHSKQLVPPVDDSITGSGITSSFQSSSQSDDGYANSKTPWYLCDHISINLNLWQTLIVKYSGVW